MSARKAKRRPKAPKHVSNVVRLHREPSQAVEEEDHDAKLGLAWWNALPEYSRRLWLERAGSAVPADAWKLYKATLHGSPTESSPPVEEVHGEVESRCGHARG